VTPRLDVFGIVVSDMARSVAFYRRLGLEFPEGAENQPHVEAELGGGVRFALDTEDVMRMIDPDWKRGTGMHAGAFHFDSPDEVDRMYRELLGAGASPHKEPWDAFWGQRYAQLRDPDGTVIDLYAALPNEASSSS
jgi:catechol 2,3-dioxygenase-like lactoylglutathione lyase family enzyme